MKSSPREVIIYSRPGCHLCDEAKAVIKRVAAQVPIILHEVNIDNDPDARARFNEEIPVIFIDGRKAFKYHIEESELRRRLKSVPI
jgi:glutaredoxin